MTKGDATVNGTPATGPAMTSYAQNAEDVVLARVFPGEQGFYVDVGAADSETASVTRHFYDRGWHGINIDMRTDAIEALESARPRDTNLQIAVGSREGTAMMHYVTADPDLSFVVFDAEEAPDTDLGWETSEVPVRTLDAVLEEHAVESVDFLKIDVEGAERQVLEGLDLGRWRPTVVVVEAVHPWSHVRSDHEWRDLLTEAGYLEALFDGLNLFFLAKEHEDLLPRLVPASVIDQFETAEVAALREHQAEVEEYVTQLEAEVAALKSHQESVTDYVRELEARVQAGPVDVWTRRSHHSGLAGEPRLAIVGTPRTGNTWIRRLLSDSVGLTEVPVHHPAEVDWEALPERCVIQLHWPRTAHLARLFEQHGIRVVSMARHPLDTVLSMLTFAQREPGVRNWLGPDDSEQALAGVSPLDDAFVDWAVSDRVKRLLALTPAWWDDPSTIRVRYEEAVASPLGTLDGLLEALSLTPLRDTTEVVAGNDPGRIHEMSGGVHVWHARGGLHRELLTEEICTRLGQEHRDVISQLGYRIEPAAAPDAAAARDAWLKLS